MFDASWYAVCVWVTGWQQPGRSGPWWTALAETAGGVFCLQQRSRYVTQRCKTADRTFSVPSKSAQASRFWITFFQPQLLSPDPRPTIQIKLTRIINLPYVTPYMATTGLFSVRYAFMYTIQLLQMKNGGHICILRSKTQHMYINTVTKYQLHHVSAVKQPSSGQCRSYTRYNISVHATGSPFHLFLSLFTSAILNYQ